MSKTVHQFECRDDIWKRVEALAKRRGVTPDEIVQAALIQLFTRKKSPTQKAEAQAQAKTPAPGPAPRGPSKPPPPSRSAGLPPPGGGARSLPRPGGSPPPAPAPSGPAPGQARPLYLFFEGNWYTVDQDEFVIGRGSKFSDLPIKDANISRRHCCVVRRNGDYFIKDLGSTNGVEFAGQRVDNHLVEEGNVYYLCDHELRFSFNEPY